MKLMNIPTPDEVTAYAESIGFKLNGEQFCDFYESKGWKIGKSPMVSWKAAVRTWKHHDLSKQSVQEMVAIKKTKLYPITGKSCRKCKMPAVYKDGSGGYDTYLCSEHLPEKVKLKYC
jgi:hypothetical protein